MILHEVTHLLTDRRSLLQFTEKLFLAVSEASGRQKLDERGDAVWSLQLAVTLSALARSTLS